MPPELANFVSAPVIFFVTFALVAVVTSLLMVLHPNPVRAALSLVLNLFCVAVLYLLLNAYFLAAVQVIVYAGAIMVLFLFVIMLLNLGSPDRSPDRLKWQPPAALIGGVALVALVGLVIAATVPAVPEGYNGSVTLAKSARPYDPALYPNGPQASGITSAPGAAPGASAPAGPSEDGTPASPPEPVTASATPEGMTPDDMGSVENVGKILYNPNQPWLFPFEITSILLLIAVIGSVVLARRPGQTMVEEDFVA